MKTRFAPITVVLAVLGLGACSNSPMNEAQPQMAAVSPYAGEPFPVRLINRAKFPADFIVQDIDYPSTEAPGTIVVQTATNKLYLVEGNGKARRYTVAIGKTGYGWKGVADIQHKTEWPSWFPTDDMLSTAPGMPHQIPPGADNPLGARALYLYANGKDTLYRIHGTSEPWTIGTLASSGCIRMFNEDVIDLYARAEVGAKVIVE